ncbi:MAG TPA: DEAD/DEAH box helicase [Solirubrobacteraceae bacterium]|nr:DEAD/DEAH box helicase [Solirubrobacteraceae bacterium]
MPTASPLSTFSPRVRAWFQAAFAAPTPAQAKAWPAIARGENVLLSAPTGSGKTLAAFLWALDRLGAPAEAPGAGEGAEGLTTDSRRLTRVVYVSPLKALAYDIERNLRAPLRGIGAGDVRVGIRTGDTPQRERAAMGRNPPDILITTPESLYLLLTSRAAETLHGVRAAIVDEIHAVAHSKRGSHLALTLERLQALSPGMQRIGLSATQRPLEEIGRFLAGAGREVTIVDASTPKPLDLRIEVPVESMADPGAAPAGAERDPLEPLSGGESTRGSIWPAIYPELLKAVTEHTSTIVFVNNRRAAERVALRLNELAGEGIARAHHGSLAREERARVEELLKGGELPCLVATSSLELGIDMGAVDLVLQIESPKSVARGLQRIGRAGHGVDRVSRGRIFPKYRGDLLECAVVCRMMRAGEIEPTAVPRNALDVLAQHVVSIAAASEEDGVPVDELYSLLTRAHPYSQLSRELFERVLDMLDGRYPSSELAALRARIVWDRVAGVIRPRRGARQLAVANAGTIPDRGLYAVTLPDGRRVGELDEEMVYEARPGQAFFLGASTWRIEEIGRDRVIVTPAPGAPGAVPFWKGDTLGRPVELGRAIGAFARWAVEQDADTLRRDYDLDERAARNLLEYLRAQLAATRVLPSDRTIVLERFRDELGDWRLCLLSPYGARVHAAWGLALSARVRERFGLEGDVLWSDDGIVLRLPDLDAGESEALSSLAELVLIEPDELEPIVTAELGSSALFGARFRESAARALLIPRAWPGRRTPLWQQRLKAQSLLEVARRYEDFPIVLETYRECLQDVLDLPGLQQLLRGLATRELALVEVETRTASPFASSLMFDYVATYMYEGDTPAAERRAAALSLDRDLLRELLGSEELRELIDPGALARVQDDLQRRSPQTRATGRDELHDVLRFAGDLTAEEIRERVLDGIDAGALLQQLRRERRAIALRIGGEQRHVAADEAGLYRDALGAAPPSGLPEAFLADVENPLSQLAARYARTHGPFTSGELRARYGVEASAVLRELERSGDLVRGAIRPGGSELEWCDVEVLRRLRRASLAALRKEIEPAAQSALAGFMGAWHGVDRHTGQGAGVERLREALVGLQGLPLPVEVWERDVLPRRVGAYSPAWLDSLCAAGELVWVGAGPVGGRSGRVALYFREDAPLLGPPAAGRASSSDRPPAPSDRACAPADLRSDAGSTHEPLRARLRAGPCFFADLLAELDLPAESLREALFDLVWAGEVTNDAWAPLREPHSHRAGSGGEGAARLRLAGASPSGRPPPGRSRFGPRRAGARMRGSAHPPGRWSLTEPLFRERPEGPSGAERRRALAELLLERHGILTREHVLAEGVAGGFAGLYGALCELETLGACRRGYFVEGLGGAQFALPGAVERLRARPGAPSRDAHAAALVLAACDPAQPFGGVLPWPRPEHHGRRPARVPGAYVALVSGAPVLYVERGGRGLVTLVPAPAGEEPLRAALTALAEAVRDGRAGRLALERIDGEPAIGSEWETMLAESGFRAGPRRLTLSA